MTINFHTKGVSYPLINEKEIEIWINKTASRYNMRVGDLSFLFCNDEKILEFNRQYLQHDYYTDIITFDYSEGDVISGDIIISTETVMSNSIEYNTNFLEELHRVIIHGILHLCGLKDFNDSEELKMREAEEAALKNLPNHLIK